MFTVELKQLKSCDRVTKYYLMLRKTGEGNDCGGITAAKIIIIKRQGMKLIWANFQPAINRQSLDKSQFAVDNDRSTQNPSLKT